MYNVAAPEYVEILLEDGRTSAAIRNVSRIGPFNEDTIVTLLCRSGGGRPVPRIEWWNGTHILEGIVFVYNSFNFQKNLRIIWSELIKKKKQQKKIK